MTLIATIRSSRILTIREALDLAIIIDRQHFGYLKGLRRLRQIADKDAWNGEYDPDDDTIILQRKVLAQRLRERVRIILHEGGHRAQYNVDKGTFERFIGKDLDRKEFFFAMANEVHLRQYELTGRVEDMAGEIFAESYARFCLGMTEPPELLAFWKRRTGGYM